MTDELTIVGITFVVFEILGVVSAIQAVLTTRTSQGAIAWSLALITWPFFTVPLYWIFGRSKFKGYVSARRSQDLKTFGIVQELTDDVEKYKSDIGQNFGEARVLEQIAQLPFVKGNDTQLLIDGPETFAAIFAAIDRAEQYVLASFFIIKNDELGNEFKQRLIDAAKRGCRVYLLYDDVGSSGLRGQFLNDLREAGVHFTGMKTTKGFMNRFQLNFRNHRKIVVIDGREAYVGGHNVGDEYVHKCKRLTPWRDTHMGFVGPAALGAQIAWLEDWHWAKGSSPELNWKLEPAESADKVMLCVPSGPDDELETCGLLFTHAINAARDRIWIASPYFVPDEGIIHALQLAALRGVDVRVLIPGLEDKWLVKRAALAYVPAVADVGVKVYEYGDGFQHQKTVLVDQVASLIGTANFDNRSFRLNFEITMLTLDEAFAKEVEAMLEADFAKSELIDQTHPAYTSTWVRLTARIARLFSPIL